MYNCIKIRLTAVVEMLVLEPEEVPDEPAEDLERAEDGREQVAVHVLHLGERDRHRPAETQHEVLHNREVVVLLRRIHDLFSKKLKRD